MVGHPLWYRSSLHSHCFIQSCLGSSRSDTAVDRGRLDNSACVVCCVPPTVWEVVCSVGLYTLDRLAARLAPISVCLSFPTQSGTTNTDRKVVYCRGSLCFRWELLPKNAVCFWEALSVNWIGPCWVYSHTTCSVWTVIWLILPVVICLSQRLSHACLSTSLTKVKPRMAH